MELTLRQIASLVGGEIRGEPAAVIRGVAGIREAGPGDLTFLANARYKKELERTRATAVLVAPADGGLAPERVSVVVVAEPSLAFSQVLSKLGPAAPRPPAGIHPTAVVAGGVEVGEKVAIGPHVVVESGARIGARSVLHAGVYIGAQVRIGADSLLYPNVVVLHGSVIGDRVTLHPGAVIGSDGFGFVLVGESAVKVPQQGTVEIEDDVEIGANTTVDRARFGKTRIGRGTKIDNLCQIAHNVEIAGNTFIAAQAGIAGSSKVGRGVMMGGQVGVSGHLTIGDLVKIAAQAGVSRDIDSGESVAGHPAMPAREFWRMIANAKKVTELRDEIERLANKVAELERDAKDHPPAS